MNKFIIVSSISIFTNIAYASETSLWLGIKGGYALGRIHIKRNLTDAVPGYQNINDHSHVAMHGANGGPFVELSQTFNKKYYIALQGSTLFSNLKGKINSSVNNPRIPLKNSLQLKHNYGADVRLGTFYNETLYFVKGGLTKGHWHIVTDGLPLMGRSELKKKLNGMMMGIGMSVPFKSFSLGAELSHTRYKNSSYPLLDRQGQTILNTRSIKPSIYEFNVHLKFKLFNSFFN
ncbi:hypothetical protein IM40_09955 (plasmid) [Candidatus Paracaedimonas acanthamoebae]|nr:hypothetical protein IM40_09955 [Candidatus Paracaedimonas acanthamoebae]